MSVVIWILAIVLALAFLAAGIMKIVLGDRLRERMPWAEGYAANTIRLIGILEVLGAIGLVLPNLLGILPWLGWLAALCLAVIMIAALVVHARRKESRAVVVNLVLIIALVIVAWGRMAS